MSEVIVEEKTRTVYEDEGDIVAPPPSYPHDPPPGYPRPSAYPPPQAYAPQQAYP